MNTNTYTTWKRTSAAFNTYLAASTACKAAFAPAPAPVAPQLSAWRKPGTTQTRRYINNVKDIVGLELTRYRSGNVSGASLNGSYVSNAEGCRIGAACNDAKFWIDEAGTLHYRDMSEYWGPREITFDEVRDAVSASIRHHVSA